MDQTRPTEMPRRKVFDTMRRVLGRGLKQSEVNALDASLDGLQSKCAESTNTPTIISPAGISLIKQYEGCARLREDGLVQSYPDPATGAEPWTIGWGATGSDIGPMSVWNQHECNARLARDLVSYSREVFQALGDAATTQSQFDAMVSFHYNTGAIARATLTKRHISGDFAGASREFARWNKAAGRVLKGLTRRRAAEAALYRQVEPD